MISTPRSWNISQNIHIVTIALRTTTQTNRSAVARSTRSHAPTRVILGYDIICYIMTLPNLLYIEGHTNDMIIYLCDLAFNNFNLFPEIRHSYFHFNQPVTWIHVKTTLFRMCFLLFVYVKSQVQIKNILNILPAAWRYFIISKRHFVSWYSDTWNRMKSLKWTGYK